ncbi:hypothetical protein NDK47_23830 [Brevibacillus ruminantium]|uniref:Uncharacterized protein n=1 Tax=Brevibacillus ruminantium TaxID=2950604 RepID=A0ABY4WE38_9BACL|nr:hypothetical protein [Brevibacillus ruminantium]USG65116.1 hypothetical protein NDK47_23830 [Brevibacillus ruminantium]
MNKNAYDLNRERKKREMKNLAKQHAMPAPENLSNWPTSVIQSVINSIQKKTGM